MLASLWPNFGQFVRVTVVFRHLLLWCNDRRKLFAVGFLRGFLGFLAGERAHGGFPRRIPRDSYGGFSLSAGIPTEEQDDQNQEKGDSSTPAAVITRIAIGMCLVLGGATLEHAPAYRRKK